MAVVSEIVASTRPREAAARLCELISAFKRSSSTLRALSVPLNYTAEIVMDGVIKIMDCVRKDNPLIHQVLRDTK